MQSATVALDSGSNLKSKDTLGLALLITLFLYTGTRPVSGRFFGDMRTYAGAFEQYQAGEVVRAGKDVYFEYFMKWSSSVMTLDFFFVLCAGLYLFPLYFACKKLFREYWFYAFLMLAASLSFWSYGVNGIRNGIATSLFLLAITRGKLIWKVGLTIIALLFHKSIMIPAAAYLIATNYKNHKLYFGFWLSAIPMSLILGGFWESFFLSLGFGEEERLAGYLSEGSEMEEQFSRTGFRWDFLIYSATGVFAGYYFTIRKKFEDPTYSAILSTYLIANAFWILIIRATFSNRFAYLSWFLLGIVIIYPLLKMKFFRNQHVVIAQILIAYFMLTYLLNVILK